GRVLEVDNSGAKVAGEVARCHESIEGHGRNQLLVSALTTVSQCDSPLPRVDMSNGRAEHQTARSPTPRGQSSGQRLPHSTRAATAREPEAVVRSPRHVVAL